MNSLYIDSSALVSVAFQDPKRWPLIKKHTQKSKDIISSELAVVECQSGLSSPAHNLSMEQQVDIEQNLNRIFANTLLIQVSSEILGAARYLVREYRKSLGLRSADAIHVATANILRKEAFGTLRIITADKKKFEVFTAQGYVTYFV